MSAISKSDSDLDTKRTENILKNDNVIEKNNINDKKEYFKLQSKNILKSI